MTTETYHAILLAVCGVMLLGVAAALLTGRLVVVLR